MHISTVCVVWTHMYMLGVCDDLHVAHLKSIIIYTLVTEGLDSSKPFNHLWHMVDQNVHVYCMM